jgi:hypothetical protein
MHALCVALSHHEQVHVCMYMHVCMYAYMHALCVALSHEKTHACMLCVLLLCLYVCVCMHACMYAVTMRKQADWLWKYTYLQLHTYDSLWKYTYAYNYIHTCWVYRICTNKYMHEHTYPHSCTRAQNTNAHKEKNRALFFRIKAMPRQPTICIHRRCRCMRFLIGCKRC